MQKFLAVVKHEYKKIVLKWSFLLGTLLLPVIVGLSAVVPMIIFSMQGETTRIAVHDPTGRILPMLQKNLSGERLVEKARQAASEQFEMSGTQEEELRKDAAMFMQSFQIVEAAAGVKTTEEVRTELRQKILRDEIDAYLIIPENATSTGAVFELRTRGGGDFIANEVLTTALNDTVRSQRLATANINESTLNELSAKVKLDAKGIDESGKEKESSGVYFVSFAIGLMIYITLAIYGQQIMAAVVEEKETRIAEILFSSARPFELMMGKLAGVGLAGLTQLAIWLTSAAMLAGVVIAQGGLGPVAQGMPTIGPLLIVAFLIYFLLGYFIYAAIYALIASMVTSVQEGSQFSFPPMMIMLASFYFCFAVIRDPNSTLSFWVSMAPFLAPITMPVRMLAEMPPLWQIALSITLNIAAIAFLVWIAARVYRVGMLMYGKRATIPEVWKWMRQA